MMNISIDTAKEEDLIKVYEIEKESFSDSWSFESFVYELKLNFSNFFIAKCDTGDVAGGDVAGYIILWQIEDELNILNLAVKKEFRRQSVAKGLLEHVFNFGKERKIQKVYLEVREGNLPALNLYKTYGFKIIGTRENYYPDSKDAILMYKNLKE